MSQDLRSVLERYEVEGHLLRIRAAIHWEYEVASVLWRLSAGPTVVFENIADYPVPIVGNLLNTRDKLALACRVSIDELQSEILAAHRSRVLPEITEDAPCQEVVLTEDIDLVRDLPIPSLSEHDGGRYITAGLLFSRDPDTGRRNVTICRLQAIGGNRLACYIAPTNTGQFLRRYEEMGRSMEVAIAIGNHPIFMAASQMIVPYDEIEFAGGLFREPVRLARCITVNHEVPAECEIVLEGVIDPSDRTSEGPFGEFAGRYSTSKGSPVITVQAVTTRANPLFQVIMGAHHQEHSMTGTFAREVKLLEALLPVVPGVKVVAFTPPSSCRFHVVISIHKRSDGDPRVAILTAFATLDVIKHVIVVDHDIDPYDPVQVEWAVATRMQRSTGPLVVDGLRAHPLDPTSESGLVTKLGLDATLPQGSQLDSYIKADVPEDVRRRIDSRWDEILSNRD